MDARGPAPHSLRAVEAAGTVGAVTGFSLALAVTSVAVPILIIQAGHTVSQVGFFVALSAVTQIGVRIKIGALMRLVADKHLVGTASLLLALGSALLVLSATAWVIVLSQLLQGAARGLFWTGIQTHALRTSTTAARGLAAVNLASGLGLMLGPVLAGLLLESSPQLAMAAAASGSAAALVPVVLMARLPVFPPPNRRESAERVSRRRGVRVGSWSAAVAGGWRGLMGAYVPVALHQAALTSTTIGAVVALANAATIGAGWAGRWVRSAFFSGALATGVLVTGLGFMVFSATTEMASFAAAALVASGLGMGLLQTIGPAVAAESVGDAEAGDAIAAVGLFRAGATFLAPFGVATLVLLMPLGYALVVMGALMVLPGPYMIRVRAA